MFASRLRPSSLSALPILLGALGVAWQLVSCAAELPVHIPPPAVDNARTAGPSETAVLSGGCFWGVQGVYEHVRGVQKVVAGYAGGDRATAHYDLVSTGTTGHAESVQITFDPAQISYGDILHIFFSVVHDPTQLDRQGPDTGSQYRSDIEYSNETQQHIALAYIAQLNAAHAFPRSIVTRVDPLKGFYAAEGYHQDYMTHNPNTPYIAINDLPKVRNLQRIFPAYYSGRPVLVSAASAL
ncbi:MAG TPA: peptide-methionine (S)-S-oxide reductase MsrA [Steroidobacteraceae bacterium]|jgi:peptide-methionine (S)-S-oxide reductase